VAAPVCASPAVRSNSVARALVCQAAKVREACWQCERSSMVERWLSRLIRIQSIPYGCTFLYLQTPGRAKKWFEYAIDNIYSILSSLRKAAVAHL
jgi:hypothetical protein